MDLAHVLAIQMLTLEIILKSMAFQMYSQKIRLSRWRSEFEGSCCCSSLKDKEQVCCQTRRKLSRHIHLEERWAAGMDSTLSSLCCSSMACSPGLTRAIMHFAYDSKSSDAVTWAVLPLANVSNNWAEAYLMVPARSQRHYFATTCWVSLEGIEPLILCCDCSELVPGQGQNECRSRPTALYKI